MSAQIIDGNVIAERMQAEIAAAVQKMKDEHGVTPGLAAVLVGDNPASRQYVGMKRRRCAKVGIDSFGYELPATTTQEELHKLILELNADPKVHGILVQLPLPDHIDEEAILSAIQLEKDVDGFHPVNIGRLAMKGREPLFIPATPYGCMVLLDEVGVQVSGANAVVLGRSNIVGLPAAMLLLHRNATVTICHSRTRDLPAVVRTADILIAAVGRPEMVKADWVKPGAVVIDVGSNRIEDPAAEKGYRWVGDVAFDEVKEVAGAITPSPGGVGPMTITMLLKNTLRAAEMAIARAGQ
ncbi:MAG: bifunctional methylenetetrahydrofolate dehydrogenase/methenyltetrahydrofolate cyclohydrolase FolD [Anaerolineae bacterium]|nr:bifunctional methylenetetrahydrofolate dehydrogenase/methenyltetrahydrofolate cyclohydrolase FolD [Anaerolineae bacterium]